MEYLIRLVDPWLTEVLTAAPAVMITGARASGKTTTANATRRQCGSFGQAARGLPVRGPTRMLRYVAAPSLFCSTSGRHARACLVPSRGRLILSAGPVGSF